MQNRHVKAYSNPGQVLFNKSQNQEAATYNDVTKPRRIPPLTISFQLETRFLEVVWQRPVSSSEYRQYIRFVGVCIAALRVKYLLTDFSRMGDSTLEDQQDSNSFLNEVKKKATLSRSARVFSSTGTQQQMYEAVIKNGPDQPYEIRFFFDQEQARDWLLQPPFPKEALTTRKLPIPLQASVRDLKRYAACELTENPLQEATTGKTETTALLHPDSQVMRCQTDFVTIVTDNKTKLLQLRWLRRVTSREYRYAVLKTARAVINNNIQAILVNNQQLGIINLEDQAWAVAITVSVLKKNPVERLAIISAPDVMQQIASENMNRRVKNQIYPQTIQYFLTEDEAIEWLSFAQDNLQETT
ncbi:STAS/SEC14 domain-containing protein [Pontibacter pudoricolor]|uniref:STAS/SEC14 domain-containing protein n=1 Tax=Pontibacter pudoricolor TaxID=2694930 RepID=UPI00139156AA|nr:STAS/SEC14 domain-containing protein [Pontibacter pudoricolor]